MNQVRFLGVSVSIAKDIARAIPMKIRRIAMLGSRGSMSRSVRLSRQNSHSRLTSSLAMNRAKAKVTAKTATAPTRAQTRSRRAKCSLRRARPSTKKGRKLSTRPRESVVPRSAVAAKAEMTTAIVTGQRSRFQTGTLRRHRKRATRNHRDQVGVSTDKESGSPSSTA